MLHRLRVGEQTSPCSIVGQKLGLLSCMSRYALSRTSYRNHTGFRDCSSILSLDCNSRAFWKAFAGKLCRAAAVRETGVLFADRSSTLVLLLHVNDWYDGCAGILLDCESENNSSTSSPAIIDDLTASTVKRLGPRGLQERLWQELTIRKADILQSVNHR